MTTRPKPRKKRRLPLNRDRVLRAALALADAGGLETLTMRMLGRKLGVEAMSLYNHVANKEDIVDGMVDLVFSEIDLPASGADWKTAMRERAIAVREALSRHRWAIGLMESRRNPGPATLRHHDAVIGSLRAAGFDMAMAAHIYPLLDSYIYGFAMTQMNLPFENTKEVAEVAQSMLQAFPVNEFPHLATFITEHAMKPGYDHANEFEWGLDVILDGLERAQDTA
ncbi:MAG: TetR/AcrR family transcriptional regulator C-terminal domain-containing protein [Actinomycetota bacterium]|nr:TetR/AcrR family transcriptional regulator C-terminal domain-containing protein [Actinomycetota bacterium]